MVVEKPHESIYIRAVDYFQLKWRAIFMESKIEVISTVRLQYSPDLYKIVDSLNRTLKKDDLMFGLALDSEDQEKAIFTIYRT